MKFNVLMPPGALAAALLPLVTDRPELHTVLKHLATATGADDLGPSPDELSERALQVSMCLRRIEDSFVGMSWAARCKFLVSASHMTVSVAASALIKHLSARQYIDVSNSGRLTYRDDLLAAEELPADGEWGPADFSALTSTAILKEVLVPLGPEEALAEVRSLQLRGSGCAPGVATAAMRWKEIALQAPAMAGVSASLALASAALEPPKWPMAVRIFTTLLGCSSAAGEVFADEVRKAAESEIRSIRPLIIRLYGVQLRTSFVEDGGEQRRSLEVSLGGCKLFVERYGNVLALFPRVQAADVSSQGLANYTEVLRRAVSAEPVFRWPGTIPASFAAQLTEDNGLLKRVGESLQMHLEVGGLRGFCGCDLMGWPDVGSFDRGSGEDVFAGYLAAAQGMPPDILDRLDACDHTFKQARAEHEDLLDYSGAVAEARLLSGGKVAVGRW